MTEEKDKRPPEENFTPGAANAYIINEEILRSRIRTILNDPKPSSFLQQISTNPLVPVILGFLLTGLVGAFLTYYYNVKQKELEFELNARQRDREREKDDRQKELERERDERQKERERVKDENEKDLEYIRSKQDRELERLREERQKDLEYQRTQQNIVAQRTIEQVRVLDQFMKYISSEKPEERELGYFVFVSLGYEKLAATIIGQRRDLAGKEVLATLKENPDKEIKRLAVSGLAKISEVEIQRIEAITNLFETSKSDTPYNDIDDFLISKSVTRSRNLLSIIKSYIESPDAQYKDELTIYVGRLEKQDSTLSEDAKFLQLLRQAKKDPIMINVLTQLNRRLFFEPALRAAGALGIKTLLGFAVVYDSMVMGGFQRIRDQTSQELNGAPLAGVDERLWIKTYLKNRRTWFANHPLPLFHLLPVSRTDFFLALAENGKWDLAPPLDVRGVILK